MLLRWREGAAGLADTPPIEQMGFVRDQHRFASWVYAVASGNLFFWLMLAWAAFGVERSGRMLLAVEGLAFLCTFAPALARMARRTAPILRCRTVIVSPGNCQTPVGDTLRRVRARRSEIRRRKWMANNLLGSPTFVECA